MHTKDSALVKVHKEIPADHTPYTDKYFLRANFILKKAGLNPRVSMKVFSHDEGRIAGLEEAVEVLANFSNLETSRGEIWITKKDTFKEKEPLMIIKGPVQSFIELETMYLGVVSHNLAEASGIPLPEPEYFREKMHVLKDIYENKSIIYFGARHYHWSLDKLYAAAALEGGAFQTSTDIGSSNIGKEGVGTTPHGLTLVLAYEYGKDRATLKTAELFDQYMPESIPRVTLVDTFNREITDSLAVARYFGKRKNSARIDTCGENIGERCSLFNEKKEKDPSFLIGTGVTIELVRKVRLRLIENGYGEYTEIILSSGFGNVEKAGAFMNADIEFKKETGYSLFSGVGIGEVVKGIFATADIFEIEGKPFAKTGREVDLIDYSNMARVI